jgi:transportin-3
VIFQDKEDFPVRKKLILDIFAEHGGALMQSIINASVFCLPSYMIVDLAEVVFELMVVDRPVSFFSMFFVIPFFKLSA